jgi:hypothetical protein
MALATTGFQGEVLAELFGAVDDDCADGDEVVLVELDGAVLGVVETCPDTL